LTNLTQSRKSCVAQESNPGHCITGNQLNHSTLIRTAKGFSMIKSHVSAREQTYFLELLLKFCQNQSTLWLMYTAHIRYNCFWRFKPGPDTLGEGFLGRA
jgi:hypothetical protein